MDLLNEEACEGCTVRLSSKNDPNRTWILQVCESFTIGSAAHCPVRLEDECISGEQCKVAVKGVGVVIEPLDMVNHTYLNGRNIKRSSPLKTGDVIKLGREVLHVDSIQPGE